jgi:aldose sugar dehydrogenase
VQSFFCTFLFIAIVILLTNNNVYAEPKFKDSTLKAEVVAAGLESPTSMAFIDTNNILVLEKNSGNVLLVANGKLLERPVLQLRIDHTTLTCCRGLLGIAVINYTTGAQSKKTFVFFYYSESLDDSNSVRNRLYRYQWDGASLLNPRLILDLPAIPGPNHPGGKIAVGKDGYIYTVIGDLNNEGLLQNFMGNNEFTDSSVIIRINPFNGKAPSSNPFFSTSLSENTKKYYGYGVRNSFGLAIDPVTGALWDTENGDKDYDEINIVPPGFNSGWGKLMGPMSESQITPNDLVDLPNSNYVDPIFSFNPSLGLTAIEFFNSGKLGDKYQNNIFVGDINHGNLYFFKVNPTRNGLEFNDTESDLKDLVANGGRELSG